MSENGPYNQPPRSPHGHGAPPGEAGGRTGAEATTAARGTHLPNPRGAARARRAPGWSASAAWSSSAW
ncbi:hypothetical protein [Nocardiopsis sp. CNR-923]|uniref:hypothetical protein n=1 Tax=Nocardiopsis sp. CNR-923 TaxID=1904965 RepID=UPI0021CCBC36|nr:hypothetical protein [Nocardiopsis sp. CNR-923]